MRVRIDKDERYPDYSITQDIGDPTYFSQEIVDLTDIKIEMVRSASEIYGQVQDFLEDKRNASIERMGREE